MLRQIKPTQLLRVLGAAIGWFALGLQFLVTLQLSLNQGLSVLNAVVIYLSFFTILTNILAASAQTSLLLVPASRAGRFFARPVVQAGIAVNIVLVSLVYEVLLRGLWSPTGWQLLADTLLHDIAPALYVLYWFVGVPRGALRWTDPLRWLIYPAVYVGYTLLRGAATGVYPYGFLNAANNGYATTAAVIVMLAVVLVVLGGFAVIADHNLAGVGEEKGPAA